MTTAKSTTTGLLDALAAFQAEMPKVGKDKTGDAGSYRYKYADLAAVSDVATPLLLKHGLVFTCKSRRTDDGNYELVGLLRHAPSGEVDESSLPLFGRKSQEIGGSITYNRRYLLGFMTGIVTDEDTDAQRGPSQRTAQPTPLELAQARVAQSFSMLHKRPAYIADMAAVYLSDHDRALQDAGVEELNSWAEEMEMQRAAESVNAATAAAERGLGAVAQ